MKVEMAESLVGSWLRHRKYCQVVNSNWKASPYWTPVVDDEVINALCENAYTFFNAAGVFLFGVPANVDVVHEHDEEDDEEDSSWRSMLLQTECDLVGLSYNGNDRPLIYAVETAFHKDGIKYSKKRKGWGRIAPRLSVAQVTAWNVALKMFKNALSMYRWFGSRDAHIVFVAPKSSVEVERVVSEVCALVRDFYRENGFDFDFELYFEHGGVNNILPFREEVLDPTNLAACVVDDTAELYLRGYALSSGVSGIDVLMLDKARELLGAENLDEMAGVFCETPQSALEAIEHIRRQIVVGHADAEQSVFDRCHGAFRAYYAEFHKMGQVPRIRDLQRMVEQDAPDVAGHQIRPQENNAAVNTPEIVLEPADREEFKERLIRAGQARRIRLFENGNRNEDVWRAASFRENSNLMGNIKSSSAYRNAARDHVVRLTFIVD